MTTGSAPRRENPITLVKRLVSGGVRLAKLEIQQGREEIGAMLSDTKGGVVSIGIAIGIALLVLITLDVTIVLGFAALFAVLADLAVAIIIGVLFLLVAALYVAFGSMIGGARIGIAVAVLVVGAAFALPHLLGFRADWLAALFVLVLQLAIAGAFVLRGVSKIRIGPPEKTIASVKEDIEWAKSRLLKRS